MSSKSVVVLMIVLMVSVACTSTNGVSPVTPLNADDNTEAVEIDATPSQTPTLAPTEEPTTSRLEATVEAATEISSNSERSTGSNNFALATFTPSENKLGPGEAREIALATDAVMTPDIEEVMTFEENPVPILFDEFYAGWSIRTGLTFSDKLKSLDGQKVVIDGYIAPPLKPRLDFFVLTRVQLAFCPFCSTDVEWPDDIALVYLPEPDVFSSEFPVRITGTLELGTSIDAETGMVSLVRIYMEEMETLR